MASLNTFMMIMPVKGVETPFIYKRSEIEETAQRARELMVKPALATLNFSCLEEIKNLINKGLVDKPYVLDIGLNLPAQGTLRGNWRNLVELVQRLPEDSIFNVSGSGDAELPLITMAMLLGGNPRVGLEDNIYYAPGRLARSNAELVARTARITRELNLEVATPDEAREILNIRR
jgi:3-keto-5-aminohexanoate cleavage enzyme